jgi:small subunit ribosomal protein S21
MTKIKVRHGESLDQALRRFNKEVLKSGIIQEAKDREHYVKPSEVKRQKNKELKRKLYFERNNNN